MIPNQNINILNCDERIKVHFSTNEAKNKKIKAMNKFS